MNDDTPEICWLLFEMDLSYARVVDATPPMPVIDWTWPIEHQNICRGWGDATGNPDDGVWL